MPEFLVGNIELIRRGTPVQPPNSAQFSILRRTIELIPFEHFPLIRYVEARRPGQIPLRGGGHDHIAKIVRLSAASFSGPQNTELNLTFLHEMGHIVDRNFGCLSQIQSWAADDNHPLQQDASALLGTAHRGTTMGPGERVADCYMVFLRSFRIFRPYRTATAPTEYQGEEATRRFRVLLNTTAFRNISSDQLRDNADETSFSRLIRSML